MVSIAQTSKKYRGRKAETYDEVREKQERWGVENETVGRWLRKLRPPSVIDCPVGTGRFIGVYAELSVRAVTGIDVSEEMIALARKKVPRVMKSYCDLDLRVGDATKIDAHDGAFDVAVCVRFLDLIDQDAMVSVLTELSRVTRRAILLTIRLGDRYVPKANTAEHDRKKFMTLVKRLGWRVRESVPFRDAGWVIMDLGR